MDKSFAYHLAGHLLSLAVAPEKTDSVKEKLSHPKLNWLKLVTTGSNHLVLPAMYIRLQEAGLLTVLPEIISDHLKNIFQLNLERNMDIINQSKEIESVLRKAGIRILFLKGLGNLLDGMYASPGERMLQDIDILVPEEQWLPAIEILKAKGYRSRIPLNTSSQPPRKHYPRLLREGSTVSTEIHRFAVGLLYDTGFTNEVIWKEKVPALNLPSAFVMSARHKIIHNFIHSQMEHQGHFYGRIFMRNLYDQLLLSKHCDLYETFTEWNHHAQKSSAYLEVLRRTFFPEDKRKKLPLSKTGLYPLRHELFLQSRFLSTGLQIAVKFSRSFIRKPFMAITDRELRMRLIQNLFDRKWYRKQIQIYRNFFGG